MCGIVGGITTKWESEIINRMLKEIKHRGPDADGFWLDENKEIFLGHSRLSIIDLSEKGAQPMRRDNLVLSYNGEIYNFQEIKKELEEKGYKFTSDSDTEVVLRAYQEWGVESVDKFVGMFAFSIWDEKKQNLILCRDRFGVKPLYYYQTGSDFFFASELKALYQHPKYKKEINPSALNDYFQFGFISAPKTIFRNTFKLEPGHFLLVNKEGKIEKKRYWHPSDYFPKEKIKLSEERVLDDLEKILQKSFSYRMVADVDVGVFLSGGIDSSLVAAILQKNNNKKIKTFSIGFQEKEYDEAPFAKKVAQALGTDHHEYYLSTEDLKGSMADFIKVFDEPFGDVSALPTYLLAKKTRQEVKVALTGDGGDELFAGYTKYEAVAKVAKLPKIFRIILKYIFSIFSFNFLLSKRYSNLREKLYKFSNVLGCDNLEEMFAAAGTYWTTEETSYLLKNGDRKDNSFYTRELDNKIEQMQLWDIKNYLANDILVKTDRSTMALGLEAREPYLDETILQYVGKINPRLKFHKLGSKYLLRKILFKHLPKELFARPKAGFRPPIEEWLKSDWGREQIKKYLNDEFIKKQDIFDPEFINKFVDNFTKGKYVNPDKLWLLLVFQMWWSKYAA